MQTIGLGMALVPTDEATRQVQEFVSLLAVNGFKFDFALHTADSIPHLSLMQAVFDSSDLAIDVVANLKLSELDRNFRINDVSIWATRIVFLNFELSEALKRLHVDVFNLWHAIARSGSADPQTFEGITVGQQESFRKTGYPFSLDEYLPHITLAHLKEKNSDSKDVLRMNELLETSLPRTLAFQKLVVFAVEPLGACRKIIKEWML
jgi:hypothetical protein